MKTITFTVPEHEPGWLIRATDGRVIEPATVFSGSLPPGEYAIIKLSNLRAEVEKWADCPYCKGEGRVVQFSVENEPVEYVQCPVCAKLCGMEAIEKEHDQLKALFCHTASVLGRVVEMFGACGDEDTEMIEYWHDRFEREKEEEGEA